MKVVILAGGYGTRLGEETDVKPKPMIEVGGRPILWHIMKFFSHFGFHEFIICLGYKGYFIKEYFANYYLHQSDITFDFKTKNSMIVHNHEVEPWKVTLVNTGAKTQTGGRIKRIKDYVDGQRFFMTYGDGLADVDLIALQKFHEQHGRLASLTAVKPVGRFGALDMGNDSEVERFQEKTEGQNSWINAGYMIMEPGVFDYIAGDDTSFEGEPLENMAKAGQLAGFKHAGFWQPMDTMREKKILERLWEEGKAPWRVWD